MVEDIDPGPKGSSPEWLANVNGTLFFAAHDPTSGRELWRSDGTPEGTVLVKDIAPGRASARPAHLTDVNGTLFFTVAGSGNARQLWKSDGTADGTVMVKVLEAGSAENLTSVNGTLFFEIRRDDESWLWKSDGTPEGTVALKRFESISAFFDHEDRGIADVTNGSGVLVFTADDGTRGVEVWKSDGTRSGTVLVQDIAPGSIGSEPSGFTVSSAHFFFSADDQSHGRELWAAPLEALGIRPVGRALHLPLLRR